MEEGLSFVQKALDLVEQTEERYYGAELHRLRGELLLQRSPHEQADGEAWFAKSLELPALATSLGACGKGKERRPKLATCSPQSMRVYRGF